MDEKTIAILRFLQPHGLAIAADVTDIINELFPYDNTLSEYDFDSRKNKIIAVIKSLRSLEYIKLDPLDYDYVGKYINIKNKSKWFESKPLLASIADKGLRYLSEYEKSKKDDEVSNSIILTNESVKETNRLVGNISIIQKNLAYASFVVIAISTLYLILTYYKDDSPALKSINTQLQLQRRLLDSMRTSQKGIDSSLRMMAKKTLPQKK